MKPLTLASIAVGSALAGGIGGIAAWEQLPQARPWTTFVEYQNPRTLKTVSYVREGGGKSRKELLYDRLFKNETDITGVSHGAEGKSSESCGITRMFGSIALFYCEGTTGQEKGKLTFIQEGETSYTHLSSHTGKMSIRWKPQGEFTYFGRSWAERQGYLKAKM